MRDTHVRVQRFQKVQAILTFFAFHPRAELLGALLYPDEPRQPPKVVRFTVALVLVCTGNGWFWSWDKMRIEDRLQGDRLARIYVLQHNRYRRRPPNQLVVARPLNRYRKFFKIRTARPLIAFQAHSLFQPI